MQRASVFKGFGYLVSSLSVVLLGIVAWKSASEQPLLFACLVGGMLASIAGMTLRWISHRVEQHDKERIEAKAETGGFPREARAPALARGADGA
jgi:hypothetical protein